MGTRGFYVYKYDNKYFVFYNHWDSYLSGLGQEIIKQLKQMTTYDIERLKQNLINIHISQLKNTGNNFTSLTDAPANPQNYCLVEISTKEPSNDLFIEFIYIINLDHNEFQIKTLNKNYSYELFNVPDFWIAS
jgi:hypothetical protein